MPLHMPENGLYWWIAEGESFRSMDFKEGGRHYYAECDGDLIREQTSKRGTHSEE